MTNDAKDKPTYRAAYPEAADRLTEKFITCIFGDGTEDDPDDLDKPVDPNPTEWNALTIDGVPLPGLIIVPEGATRETLEAQDGSVDLEPTAEDIAWAEEFLDGLSPEVVEAIRMPTARGVRRRGGGG